MPHRAAGAVFCVTVTVQSEIGEADFPHGCAAHTAQGAIALE